MADTPGRRIALVTGAGRGIGQAICAALAARGDTVVAADIDGDLAAATAREAGNGSIGIELDVGDRAAVDDVVEDTEDRVGPIAILVNNAGINRDAMLHKMTDDQWHAVLAVDLSAVFYTVRAVGRHMRQHGYGRIVNISSASWMGNIGQTNYAAAKAGVVGLTRSVAKELARFHITANAVCPGFIDTDMTRGLPAEIYRAQLDRIPLGRAGVPQDVAEVVAFLSSDSAEYVTGEVIAVGGGYTL
ncbi:3-oxoacyl-ACP reductase FabG [Nocardia sp. NBC_00508]|uniref:3-oxoacyl-ACP reductase FabG n=1 Tax=Nocardia sp. NBC_00508 TaxID=2975992 RepID=UPI002E81E7B6|nr:3-oxoacyl-ACP reductase FabG [Nocardia sp. NBC_00508]WUD65954.1 3-oxoacyl-ACP reductase FabG [Nocardia sp. NBC_00508]